MRLLHLFSFKMCSSITIPPYIMIALAAIQRCYYTMYYEKTKVYIFKKFSGGTIYPDLMQSLRSRILTALYKREACLNKAQVFAVW